MALTIRQHVFRNGAGRRIPVSGTFELTPRCNLDCKMCYVHMTPEEARPLGEELTAEEWLAVGRQAVEAGMIYLLLTGGEPMLRPDFATVYTEMVKLGVLVSVNTNGTLLTPEVLECFQKHPPEVVNLTLYGASPDTYESLCGVRGGYEKATAAVRALRAAGIRVALNTTFTHCNARDMEALVSFAAQVGVPIRTAAYTFPPVRNGREACSVCFSPEEQGVMNARFEAASATPRRLYARARYLEECLAAFEARKIALDEATLPERGRPVGCMAGRGQFWMAWNGEMYSCGMLSHNGVKPADGARVGDFKAMWAETVRRTEEIFLPAKCTDCPFFKICPNCPAVTVSRHGVSHRLADEMCRYTETYARTLLSLAEQGKDTPSRDRPPEDEGDPFVCL